MTRYILTREGNTKPRRCFVVTAAVILAMTGFSKVWSALGQARALDLWDPIFGTKFANLMLMTGAAEILVVLICFVSKRQTLTIAVVAWFSTNLAVYRLSLWWIGWKRPCSCLGNLTDALHISPQLADNIMKIVLAYLLVCSYALLSLQWLQHIRTEAGSRASARLLG